MTIAHATAPSRSTATAVISWGLINIPISLYTSTEATRIARSEYVRDAETGALYKVGRRQYNTITGEDVASSDVVKCATSSGEQLVPLTDEEIAAVTGESDGTAPIVALVSVEQLLFDYCIAKYYQVRPKAEKKGGAASEQAFALLTAALESRGQAAILKISVRNAPARFAALLSDGTLLLLHYTDEVRAERPMPSIEIGERELEMAGKLLDAIGSELPEMRDETSARIQDYVDAKATGGDVAETTEPTPISAGTTSLEDLLAASIKAAS